MKKKVLTMALLIINAITLNAQTTSLSLKVRDAIFNRPLAGVHVQILSPDSLLVDTCEMIRLDMGVKKDYLYVCEFPNKNPYFLLKLSKKGFDTEFVRVESAREVTPPPVLLRKTPIQLDSAIVRASKIMMVMHGDTIVYNADVFELSEGSMLDALIEQLPGVKLEAGGIITVNGNPVSRLLIDGKDFFSGNPAVALENLPAYTVSKVKAYQKAPDNAYLTRREGEKHSEDPWVIDVNLKPEYHAGGIANAEVGAGTKERYLGKGFGMYFNDRFRLGAYTNFNNLNDNRRAGHDGNWSAGEPLSGQRMQQRGGLFFLASSKDDKTEINTTLEAFHDNENMTTFIASESFLNSGNIHNRSQTVSRTCNRGIVWDGNLSLMRKKTYWFYQHHFDCSFANTSSSILSAELSKNPVERYRLATLDSIFSLSGYSMLPYVTNYYSDFQKKEFDRWNYAGVLNSTIQLPWKESLNLIAVATYHKTKSRTFSNYLLRTPSVSNETTFNNRFFSEPEKRFSLSLLADYCLIEKDGNWHKKMFLTYEEKYEHNKRDRLLHRLDRLGNGWDEQGYQRFGTLPSTVDSLALAIDWTNSYYRSETHWKHTPQLRFMLMKDDFQLFMDFPFTIENARLNDLRLESLQVKKQFLKFEPMINLEYKRFRFYAKYKRNVPDLHLLLDVTDNSNPLAVFMGNEGLKPTDVYYLKGAWQLNIKEYAQNAYASLEYYAERNAVGQNRAYDPNTGVYTYKPMNINGNWQAELRGSYARNLNKTNHWNVSFDGKVHYNHSVDFEWTNYSDVINRSIVHNYSSEATLSLRYRSKPLNAGFKTTLDWQHATSERADFQKINSLNILYSLTAQAKLPWDIDVNSDLTFYTRNGYEDETMNTNEWVWNMSVEKRLLRNKSLTLKFTAFDLLAQRSNIMRTLNAQGRTETWYNTIPRYFLFSIAWRFHKAPRQN